jgi:hypothetical protein
MNQKTNKLHKFAVKEFPDENYLQEIFDVMLEAWIQVVVPDIQTSEPRITALWKDQCCLLNRQRYNTVGSNFDFFIESLNTDPKTGKQISRKDFEVRLYCQSDSNSIKQQMPFIVIESKKINGTSSLSEYIGEHGMLRFTTGKYNSLYFAMAGYIVQDTIEKIKQTLLEKIKNSVPLVTQGDFQAWTFLPEYAHNGTTQHLVEKREITIHHLFLMIQDA